MSARVRLLSRAARSRATGMLLVAMIAGAAVDAVAHGELHVVIERLTVEIASNPGDIKLLMRRADMHRLHHAFEAADADYARALALDPTHQEARWMRARSRLEGGRPETALAELDAFVLEHADHASARLTRARTLTALGRASDAVAEYGEALRRIPHPEPDLYFESFRAERSAGLEPAVRLASVKAALARAGPVPTLEDVALDIEIESGDFDAALARLDRRGAGAPRQEHWQFRRGQVLKLAKRNAEAREAFKQCLAAIEALPPAMSRNSAIATLARETRGELDALARQ